MQSSPLDIEWATLFAAECARNRAQVVSDAQASPIPDYLVEKINNLIQDDGLSFTRQEIIDRIPTDEVYQSKFMKHPTRQSWHEKTQIAHINSQTGITAVKAKGQSQKLAISTNLSDKKNWIDCIVTLTGRTGHVSMKYVRVTGNHQRKQADEQVNFVERVQDYIDEGRAQSDEVFLAIGDGEFFAQIGNSGARDAINRYNDRIFAGTSGEAIIWLSSLT